MLMRGIMPPSAVKLSCMAFTAPHDAAVVTTANSEEAAMPKRTSLPSILPPVRPSALSASLPCASAQEQNAHGGEDRPALAHIADHAAEHIGQSSADGEDRDDLHEVRQRRRILER